MDWKKITTNPPINFGWFVVATLPRNHSGSLEKNKTNLEGDNSWRKSFGFSKAWFNNGEWYEPSIVGNKSENISKLVTHWDYLPEVPILNESFLFTDKWTMYEKLNKEELKNLAKKEWGNNQKYFPNQNITLEDFSLGFIKAFEFLGY